MDWLNQIWVWILGGLGGLTVGGIITAICTGFIKGSVSKTIAKVNVAQIEERAVNNGSKQIKGVTFKHSIQPIVESELKKIEEKTAESIKTELAEIRRQYTHLICIQSKLAAYFDNSIVSEAKKEELHKAIEQAQTTPLYVESVALQDKLQEDKETVKIEPKEDVKNDIIVER